MKTESYIVKAETFWGTSLYHSKPTYKNKAIKDAINMSLLMTYPQNTYSIKVINKNLHNYELIIKIDNYKTICTYVK